MLHQVPGTKPTPAARKPLPATRPGRTPPGNKPPCGAPLAAARPGRTPPGNKPHGELPPASPVLAPPADNKPAPQCIHPRRPTPPTSSRQYKKLPPVQAKCSSSERAGKLLGLTPHGTGAPVYAKRPLSVKGMLPLTRNTTFRTLAPAGVTLELPLPSPARQPDPNASRAAKKK